MNMQEYTLWLDSRFVTALERQHGTLMQDLLQAQVDALIRQLPAQEYDVIQREIHHEDLIVSRNRKQTVVSPSFTSSNRVNISILCPSVL